MLVFQRSQLEVSDDKVTENGLEKNSRPILFVSSRDHMLGEEEKSSFPNMLDYAESFALGGERDKEKSLDVYGKIRGMGHNPSKKTKDEWYGYEEYIKNGGFETVEIESLKIDDVYSYPEESLFVPVQSQADVMMIHGHGTKIESSSEEPPLAGIDTYERNTGGKMAYRPDYTNISNKETWDANMERFMGTILQGSYTDTMIQGSLGSGSYQIDPDFGSSAYGDWGNFWGQINSETRWLVLVSCTNMSEDNTAGSRPDKNWQKVVQDSYVKSVCGFSEIVVESNGFLRGSSNNMLSDYSATLRTLIFLFGDMYEPNTACYLHPTYWANVCNNTEDCFTQDMSIAAWMEAAYSTIVINVDVPDFLNTKIDSAAAVDGAYKWYIAGAEDFASSEPKDESLMKIYKKLI